ncbi:hypothetical protein [Methylobacterium sp. J-077]|uniref:hypothetical protein n=1 Tax=Methylobacterium sp. J-077 TaxID=2836656 RepID=UPI001FB8B70F|nr:hypothetical protein [Methylobacterium sp. J-077]MCJ2125104.1 hypothetical protein [Methylobacterium sp. J-077]
MDEIAGLVNPAATMPTNAWPCTRAMGLDAVALKKWTIERIRDLKESEQRTLYERALIDPAGSYIVDIMNENGLKPKPKLMSFTDPIYKKMVIISKSAEGKAAMEAAASEGKPAICSLDKLFQSLLGEDYSDTKTPGTIMSAGSLAAEIMRKLGYINAGNAKCPEGCIAREGIIWAKG